MKKFLIILYITIFVALAYYVATLIFNRDFKQDNNPIEIKDEQNLEQSNSNTSPDISNPEVTTEIIESTVITKDAAYKITRSDCDNNCTDVQPAEKKDYCNQICGLSSSQTTSNSCDGLSDLSKDYCLRNEAISKKDLTKCEEIQDGGIMKQCLNRINEDFIDEVM